MVADSGVVKYLSFSCSVWGYSPSDFNIANRKAFINGIALYLNIDLGVDGVSIGDIMEGMRRRALLEVSSVLQVKVLLTQQDSTPNVAAALDTKDPSNAASLLRTMGHALPDVQRVEINYVAEITEEAIDEYDPMPRERENVLEFGWLIIAVAILVVAFTPPIALFAGVAAGPNSHLGRAMMVLIGEVNYQKLRFACFGPSAVKEDEAVSQLLDTEMVKSASSKLNRVHPL